MLNLLIQLESKPNLKCINVTQFGKKKITIQIYFHLNTDYFIPYYYFCAGTVCTSGTSLGS